MAETNTNPIAPAAPAATPAAAPAATPATPAAPAAGDGAGTATSQALKAATEGSAAPAVDPAAAPVAGAETKPPVQGEPQNKVPEKYELKRAENSYLGDGAEEKIALIAKERGLSNEAAQSLLNEHDSVLSSYVDGQLEAFDTTRKGWLQQVQNDQEIGGANQEATRKLTGRVLMKFAPQGFIDLLETSGYGDNPDVLKFLSRIGRGMSEPQLAIGGDTSSDARPKDLADRLFGEGTEVK